ncbi:beta-ketoacyl synthase N-terminal-like domain-containing protein [Bradyrhizobium barranii]
MGDHFGDPLALVFGAGMVVPNSVALVWPSLDQPAGEGKAIYSGVDEQALIAGTELGPRELKKMDRMAVLALFAARQAWRDAGCDDNDRAICGIISGNAVAGWTFTEPQLRKLYSSGIDDISPYLASAWFPAASQGQISIHMKLRGYAKTIATDRCAGTQAVGLAAEAISAGRGERFLAGGAEAPLTPFVEGASTSFSGSLSTLAEGAAYLVLGPAVRGRAPVAGIYAHVTTVLPEKRDERLACCLQLLDEIAQGFGTDSQAEVLVDSSSTSDRFLLAALETRPWVRRAWWVGNFVGDALAATGPIAAAALCGRYAATPDAGPAILLSIGIDFASAIAVAAAIQEQEASYVSH